MYVVIGLGNPGPEYVATRHNVGFLAVDDLAERLDTSFQMAAKFSGQVATAKLPASPGREAISLVLLKPTTYMNNSGKAARALAAYYKVEPGNIIVIHDELDLEPGRMRIKLGGGDNGHNGLKSLRAHLGTGDFLRVRVGIGRPRSAEAAVDYVLAPIRGSAFEHMRVDAAVAADAVELLITDGLVAAQNRFNS